MSAEEKAIAPSWFRLLPLALLLAGGAAFLLLGGRQYLSVAALAHNHERLAALVARWGLVAALVYVAVYAGVAALSVPGAAVLTIAGGILFGTWLATLYTVLGATAGATAVFLAVRAGFGGFARRAGPFAARLEAGFRRNAFNYLLVLRLVALFPFWLVNLVAALLDVPLRTYVLATLIGIVPGTFVYASLGAGLGAAIEHPDLGIVFRPSVLLPLLGLAALALLPVAYRRWRGGLPS
jgi:uncharacterized membrane protein YdjX (TVP38/TMEM64 family)